MRRRDYLLLGEAFRDAKRLLGEGVPHREAIHLHYVGVVAVALKNDNKGLDVDRFMRDCGTEPR